MRIPKFYFLNDNLLRLCLRGIFDTDGCICRHRKNDPMIEIDSYNPNLRDSIVESLKKLNFRVSYSGRKIYIYSRNNIIEFFQEVGSKNLRHLVKYEHWIKTNIMVKTNMIKHSNGEVFEKILNGSNNKNWVMFNNPELFKIVEYQYYLKASVV